MTRTYCDICGRDCDKSMDDMFGWREYNWTGHEESLTVCKKCNSNMRYFFENSDKIIPSMSLSNRLRFLFKKPLKEH